MKRIFGLCLLGAMAIAVASFTVVSCDKDGSSPDVAAVPEMPTDKFETKAVWLGPQNEHYADLSSRVPGGIGTVVTSSSKFIFTDVENFIASRDVLSERFLDGAVIVIFSPDFSRLVELFKGDRFGIPASEDMGEMVLVAISKYGIYKMYKPSEPQIVLPKDGLTDEDGNPVKANPPELRKNFDEIGWRIPLFKNWVQEMLSKSEADTKAGESSSDITTQISNPYIELFSFSWPNYYCIHARSESEQYWLGGTYQASAKVSYEPVYAYEGQNASGDYYLMDVEYESDMNNLFVGHNVRPPKYGCVELEYSGMYLRELNVSTSVECGSGTVIFDQSPIPQSANKVENHTDSYSFSKGMGLSAGLNVGGSKGPKGGSGRIGGKLGANFSYSKSESHSVSYTVSDLDIFNTANIGKSAAGWNFKVNESKYPTTSGDEVHGEIPGLSRGTAFFNTSWVWYYKDTKDYDTQSIGNLVVTITPILGATVDGSHVTGAQNKYELEPHTKEMPLYAPFRIPFGTVEINNNWPVLDRATFGNVIFALLDDKKSPVMEEDEDGKLVPVEYAYFEGQDIGWNENATVNLPVGWYRVRLTQKKDGRKTVLYSDPVMVDRRVGDTVVQLKSSGFSMPD